MTLAHHPVAPSELWGAWNLHPVVLMGLVLAAALYHRGATLLRARRRPAVGLRPPLAFAGALAAAAVALVSPLDAAASSLFAAHMLQHLLLMLVVAPLLVASHPTVVLSAALPPGARRRLNRARADRRVRRAAGIVTLPVAVWAAGSAVLWAWHLPSLYDAAVAHEAVHVAEHASLVAVAALLWAVVLGRVRRPVPAPVAVLLVFATGLQGAALGAVLALARSPLYGAHLATAPLWDLTPLEDQQLAGGLMWVPPGLVYFAVMAALLGRWLGSMEEHPESNGELGAASGRLAAATGEPRP